MNRQSFAAVLIAVAATGCPSRDAPTAPVEAAAPETGASAALDAAADATPLAPAPSRRPLPAGERLVAPFKGTRAHGFVAMSNLDRSAPPAARRVATPLAPGDALDLDKPVLVASFTKLWTAVAALRMAERGEIYLHDTVKEALPELASRPWAESTIRELLTHTSLVPELYDKDGFARKVGVDFSAPVAVLSTMIPATATEKRGTFKYRNSELALVGAILAAKSKMSAEDVLRREIFTRARMEHAGLLVTTVPRGLDLSPMGPVRPQNFFTAGAGYASANDLLSFFEALSGSDLLTPGSKAILFGGAADRGHGALGCWAYPFALPDGGTTLLVERPGSFGNVRLFSAYFPEQDRAIVAWTGDGVDIPRPRVQAKGIGAALVRAALE
ncbi:MAG: beta-lactamase family protein [Labilithrix sp.]|nr:beta-lactamase family protein [Labilithrix sp.]